MGTRQDRTGATNAPQHRSGEIIAEAKKHPRQARIPNIQPWAASPHRPGCTTGVCVCESTRSVDIGSRPVTTTASVYILHPVLVSVNCSEFRGQSVWQGIQLQWYHSFSSLSIRWGQCHTCYACRQASADKTLGLKMYRSWKYMACGQNVCSQKWP